MRYATLAALACGALLIGCGSSDDAEPAIDTSSAAAARADIADTTNITDTLKIVDFVYDPTPATVRAGQRISVPNADAAPHTITDAGSGKTFDSGTIKGKATGSVTFEKAGMYSYICEFHPFMKGEVTVTQ